MNTNGVKWSTTNLVQKITDIFNFWNLFSGNYGCCLYLVAVFLQFKYERLLNIPSCFKISKHWSLYVLLSYCIMWNISYCPAFQVSVRSLQSACEPVSHLPCVQ